MSGIVQDLLDNWYIDLSIPLVAALIGYVTKLVAIRMMFEPIDFVGRRPWLGWQGVVPRRAARMASIAVDTMTRDLLSAEEVVRRLDPDRIVAEIERPLLQATAEITREIMTEYQPGVWDALPAPVRDLVVARAQAAAPQMVRDVVHDLQRDVDAVFDLRTMVVTDLVTDKALLNRIFREAGRKEFRFIARSGIYFGLLLGLLQLALWLLFHEPLIMPVFGLIVGWCTDWLALKLIFNPKRPISVLGFEIQGMFLKRRREVARDYGTLIADEVITPRKVVEAILRGPLSDRVAAMILREVQVALDRSTGPARPLVLAAVGTDRMVRMQRAITDKVMARLPQTLAAMEDYATETMAVRQVLVDRMERLDDDQFEALIRPAFEQDEWILIAVGAALGFVMGELQALVLEHLTTR